MCISDCLLDLEKFARKSPAIAICYALGAGFILRLLPIRQIVIALVRLLLVLIKPVALLLGILKLYELVVGQELKPPLLHERV